MCHEHAITTKLPYIHHQSRSCWGNNDGAGRLADGTSVGKSYTGAVLLGLQCLRRAAWWWHCHTTEISCSVCGRVSTGCYFMMATRLVCAAGATTATAGLQPQRPGYNSNGQLLGGIAVAGTAGETQSVRPAGRDDSRMTHNGHHLQEWNVLALCVTAGDCASHVTATAGAGAATAHGWA